MAETTNIYEPREWRPVAHLFADLAAAFGLDTALRELNVAVFKKRVVRLLREPNNLFGGQPPEPELASDEFLSDYRFVLRGARLDLHFQGPPEKYDGRAILWFGYYLSIEDTNDYWPELWPVEEDKEDEHPTGEKGDRAAHFRTGAPGRPTASHIVIEEAKRRLATGEVKAREGHLDGFGRTLEDWWEQERVKSTPPAPKMSARTIANKIRDIWRKSIKN